MHFKMSTSDHVSSPDGCHFIEDTVLSFLEFFGALRVSVSRSAVRMPARVNPPPPCSNLGKGRLNGRRRKGADLRSLG